MSFYNYKLRGEAKQLEFPASSHIAFLIRKELPVEIWIEDLSIGISDCPCVIHVEEKTPRLIPCNTIEEALNWLLDNRVYKNTIETGNKACSHCGGFECVQFSCDGYPIIPACIQQTKSGKEAIDQYNKRPYEDRLRALLQEWGDAYEHDVIGVLPNGITHQGQDEGLIRGSELMTEIMRKMKEEGIE